MYHCSLRLALGEDIYLPTFKGHETCTSFLIVWIDKNQEGSICKKTVTCDRRNSMENPPFIGDLNGAIRRYLKIIDPGEIRIFNLGKEFILHAFKLLVEDDSE